VDAPEPRRVESACMFQRWVSTAAAAAAIALLSAGGISDAKPRVWRIAGAVRDAKGKWAPAERVVFEAEKIRVSMQYLDGSSRRLALASVTGREADLFPEPSETVRGYLVFTLEIENAAGEALFFEPGQSRFFADGRRSAEIALEYAGLYEIVAQQPPGGPSLEDAERAVYARALTIQPGGAVRKLLVFRAPRDGKWKNLEVQINALHLAAADLDAVFRFRRFEVKP